MQLARLVYHRSRAARLEGALDIREQTFRKMDDFGAVEGIELDQYTPDERFHGALADRQLISNNFVRLALPHLCNHLHFARRQTVRQWLVQLEPRTGRRALMQHETDER